jgi:hypothetical protein
MAEDSFNSIAILDAVPEGELSTALALREHLRDIADYKETGLRILYFKIERLEDLQDACIELLSEAESNNCRPWIHFDGHGNQNEDGAHAANGEFISWMTFRDCITPINTQTNIGVVLTLSACFGGSFARSMRTTDRAPVLALIGPSTAALAGDLKLDFQSFHSKVFESKSILDAIAALTANAGDHLYYHTSVKWFFYEVWASYKLNQCNEKAIRARAVALRKKLKNTDARVPGVASVIRLLKREEEAHFDKYRDNFFMVDLFPENFDRFEVTYDEAERLANERLG